MTNIDHAARCEKRLRNYLEVFGRGRENSLYHRCCNPHYIVTKDQFETIVSKLVEEGVAEVMSGARPNSLWIVRKDYVDQTIADGVTN